MCGNHSGGDTGMGRYGETCNLIPLPKVGSDDRASSGHHRFMCSAATTSVGPEKLIPRQKLIPPLGEMPDY